MDSTELVEAMEHFISDSYEKDGRTILFFEYVPEELWEELKDTLMRLKS